MSADLEEMIALIQQTRHHADELGAVAPDGRSAWQECRDAWEATRLRAREVRAESRNHRYVAMLRRALARRAP